jgi:hypothetical protein
VLTLSEECDQSEIDQEFITNEEIYISLMNVPDLLSQKESYTQFVKSCTHVTIFSKLGTLLGCSDRDDINATHMLIWIGVI